MAGGCEGLTGRVIRAIKVAARSVIEGSSVVVEVEVVVVVVGAAATCCFIVHSGERAW